MLQRKISTRINQYFSSNSPRILIVDGARQVGKSFIIRHLGQSRFKHYVEVNLLEDANGTRLFDNAVTPQDFYLRLSSVAGNGLGSKSDTLVFLDEIQAYPRLITMLKFLRAEDRFTYIASGSQLGLALADTASIPIGSIETVRMFPLDFEEYLMAQGVGQEALDHFRERFEHKEALDEGLHRLVLNHFKRYLLCGGLPGAVNAMTQTSDIQAVRRIQDDIRSFYAADAGQYDRERRLKIRRVYDLIPSNLQQARKRVFYNRIEGKVGSRFNDYAEEFDYLTASGIALEVRAVSQIVFPLLQSTQKNLLKLYLNDVGLLTGLLYAQNVGAVLDDTLGVNLGAVYESAVAQELAAHGHRLHYYDSKKHGEVDFLIENKEFASVLPIEVKSGRDYTVHSALDMLTAHDTYGIRSAYVLSNEREVSTEGAISYLPVYYAMYL
ncbi:MAG: ATP-binding protein [Succinivibrio sp.]|nr:ATP-binding protein [Succinivibrio sp.]